MRYRMQCGPIDRGHWRAVKEQIPELELCQENEDTVRRADEKGIPKITMGFLDSLVYEDHVHMEDDIILCKNFKDRLNAVIKEIGTEHVITFFTTKRYGEGGWMDGGKFMFNQCVFLPKNVAIGMDAFARNKWFKNKFDLRMIDVLVADYLRWSNREIYAVVPSLVRHDASTSYLFKGTANRDCWRFIDDE